MLPCALRASVVDSFLQPGQEKREPLLQVAAQADGGEIGDRVGGAIDREVHARGERAEQGAAILVEEVLDRGARGIRSHQHDEERDLRCAVVLPVPVLAGTGEDDRDHLAAGAAVVQVLRERGRGVDAIEDLLDRRSLDRQRGDLDTLIAKCVARASSIRSAKCADPVAIGRTVLTADETAICPGLLARGYGAMVDPLILICNHQVTLRVP